MIYPNQYGSAIERDLWNLKWGRWGSLQHMCRYGVDKVRKGEYDVIRFELFNGKELIEVRNFMDENYPDVPWTWKCTTIDDILPTA